MIYRTAIISLLAFMTTFLNAQQLPPEIVRYADLVLFDGKILTADKSFSTAEAVAIRDGKFLAVGSSNRILALAGPQTVRVDLLGRTTIPGFVGSDADNDFAAGNLYKETQINGKILGTQPQLKKEEIFQRMRQLLSEVPAGEPAFFRFNEKSEALFFTKEDLDPVAPSNPIMVTAGSFDSVLNSLMLEQLLQRLPKEHPSIGKDEQTGDPNGQVFGLAMGVIGWDLRPWPRIDETYLEEQKEMIAQLNARGVTTLIGHIQGFSLTVLNLLHHRGELDIRVRASHDFLRQNPHAEAYLRRLGNLVDFGLGDMVIIIGAGLSAIDGDVPTGAALTLKPKISSGGYDLGPYGKNNWLGYSGEEVGWESPALDRSKTEWASVMAALRYGWNFAGMHNVGDGATAIWLEAIEEGLSDPESVLQPTFRPFSLDHNLFWDESQTQKLNKYGVRRGLGKMFGRPEEAVLFYGERLHDVQPVPQLIKQGSLVHIEGTRPFREIQSYVTRKDENGHLWGPDHAVDRETALLMKTLWGARFVGEDDRLGSIEAGKLADLAVLGEDYMTVPAERISDIPVVMTVVGGRIVYQVKP